jgi:hypothetical protein
MMTQATVRFRWPAERVFYSGMALAMFVTVFIGFGRTFFLRPWFPEAEALAAPETLFYVHGAFFAAWMLLLVLQPTLVAAGRTDLHRMLGKAGAALAIVMVVLGIAGSLLAAKRATGFMGVPVPPLQFLVVPLADIALFATFTALAIAWRRDSQAHKRLMLLATINLLTAAVARVPLDFISTGGPPAFFALTDVFVLAIAAWDFASRGRLHPVTLWGGLAIVASQPLRLMLSGTDAWLAFAAWAVS